jgi:hypothetical protein
MTPAKILIVEDARITAEDLRDVLTELGLHRHRDRLDRRRRHP